MDFQEMYDQVKNPFRVTFIAYGFTGQKFLNWQFNNDKPRAGYMLFPAAVEDGRSVAPVDYDVKDNWYSHAVIIDPQDNQTARDAILQVAYVDPNIQVITGKESDDN